VVVVSPDQNWPLSIAGRELVALVKKWTLLSVQGKFNRLRGPKNNVSHWKCA
jgi:hypothetical protein